LDAEAVERRLEPGIDLRRGQAAGGIDVGQAGNGDVLEEHGRAAMQQTEPYRVPVPPPRRMRGLNAPRQRPQRQAAKRWLPRAGSVSGWMVSACRPGASLRARVSSSSRTLSGLRSMKAIECLTATSTSPRFSQPAGGLEATRTALAPGAMCTQVQADSARAKGTVRIMRMGVSSQAGATRCGHCAGIGHAVQDAPPRRAAGVQLAAPAAYSPAR